MCKKNRLGIFSIRVSVYLTYKQTVSSLSRKPREHRKFCRLFLQVDPWGSRFVRTRDASVFTLSTWNICRDKILMVTGITGSSFVKTNEPIALELYSNDKNWKINLFYFILLYFYAFLHDTIFFLIIYIYIFDILKSFISVELQNRKKLTRD